MDLVMMISMILNWKTVWNGKIECLKTKEVTIKKLNYVSNQEKTGDGEGNDNPL